MNEDANGIIKAVETRMNLSKVLKHMTLWMAPVLRRLLASFKRTENDSVSCGPPPKEWAMESLFRPVLGKGGAEHPEKIDLRSITKSKTKKDRLR